MLWNWEPYLPAFWPRPTAGWAPISNVLPLITIGLFIWQQKMFMPPPTDEQSAMQQKMMQYMMIFMSFMFFKVASGLCLYFIACSLWGIAERKLLPRTLPARSHRRRFAISSSGQGRRQRSRSGSGSAGKK